MCHKQYKEYQIQHPLNYKTALLCSTENTVVFIGQEFLFQIQRGSVQSVSSFASVITWSGLLRNDLTKPNSTAVTDSPSLHLLPSWLHLMSTHSASRCSVDKENSGGGSVCEICDILPTTTALITGGGRLKGRWKTSSATLVTAQFIPEQADRTQHQKCIDFK